MANKAKIGTIGGSGLYSIDGLKNQRFERVYTPFGEPSDEMCFGELDGVELVFLPRHAKGHKIPPSSLNYQANIAAFKQVGVEQIVSISAVGSLKEELAPGTFVIIDQFVDRTFARQKSFFGEGLVAHVSMAHPVCGRLGDALEVAAKEASIKYVRNGTYLVMEGPQFSTLAESNLYRQWGMDVIGMTNMPEAKLAREAEMCFATVAMVTDYDCWHEGHDNVTVEMVIKVLMDNSEKAKALIKKLASLLGDKTENCVKGCNTALDYAIVTPKEQRDNKMVGKLWGIAGRVL